MSRFPFVFEYPEETYLWRFMDFLKFAALLDSRELHFARADMFEDPYEGEYATKWFIEQLHDHSSDGADAETYKRLMQPMKFCTYISCWHINSVESAAMWKLYANQDNGLAIVTSFETLRNEISDYRHNGEEQISYGSVQYGEPEEMYKNCEEPFLYKRECFRHESEFRMILQPWIMEDGWPTKDTSKYEVGIGVPIQPDRLIERVVVAPFAPDWVVKVVKDVTLKYGYSMPVEKSDLYTLNEPFFISENV